MLYVEVFCENSAHNEMAFLTNMGISSSSWSIIKSLSKLSLSEDRWLLVQHFFLLPGIELERWMYPQPWTQGLFYESQGWWNVYLPVMYLHSLWCILFDRAAASCLDSCSRTSWSSIAATRCTDSSCTPRFARAEAHQNFSVDCSKLLTTWSSCLFAWYAALLWSALLHNYNWCVDCLIMNVQ